MMQVDAKTPQPRHPVRRVCDVVLPVILGRVRGQGRKDGSFDLWPGERGGLNLARLSFHADRRWRVRDKQQIATLLDDQLLQPAIQRQRSFRLRGISLKSSIG